MAIGKFAHLLHRFGAQDKAVAVVEFALVLPLMLTLFLGSVDLSQGISADRKLAQVAATMGDLTSQSQKTISITTLDDYFSASQVIMLPFDGNAAQVRLVIVRINADGTTSVDGSRSHNGAAVLPVNSPYPLPPSVRDAANGSVDYVVVSEAWYNYRPITGYIVSADIPLYKQFFYFPRFGDRIQIVN